LHPKGRLLELPLRLLLRSGCADSPLAAVAHFVRRPKFLHCLVSVLLLVPAALLLLAAVLLVVAAALLLVAAPLLVAAALPRSWSSRLVGGRANWLPHQSSARGFCFHIDSDTQVHPYLY
jgi:hypothetical protein